MPPEWEGDSASIRGDHFKQAGYEDSGRPGSFAGASALLPTIGKRSKGEGLQQQVAQSTGTLLPRPATSKCLMRQVRKSSTAKSRQKSRAFPGRSGLR